MLGWGSLGHPALCQQFAREHEHSMGCALALWTRGGQGAEQASCADYSNKSSGSTRPPH